MNRNYKVIWNQSLNCFMAVAEYAKSRGKSSSTVVSSSASTTSATGGMRLLRLSALSAGLVAAGMSMQAVAGYEAGGSNSSSTRTNCTPGIPGIPGIPGTSGTVGTGTEASGAIAIGGDKATEVACAPTDDSIAIGGSASTIGALAGSSQSIAIGTLAKASGDQSVALGANVIASGNSSVAIGGDDINKIADNKAKNDTYQAITGVRLIRGDAAGGSYQGTSGEGAGASAFGVQAYAKGDFSTALGMTSLAEGAASVALGVNSKATEKGALAIGAVSNASGVGSVALGINSKSSGLNSIAIGSGSTSATGANASGDNATSIGSQSIAAANATAIGSGAKANIAGGVAIGTGSVANIADGIKGFDPSTGGATNKISNVWVSTRAAVALGDSATGITRQLTGLAAGTNDSDAVNVAQLNTLTNQTFKIQANNDTASAVKSSDTVKFKNGSNVEITRSGNDITIATSSNPSFTTVTSTGAMSAGSLNTGGALTVAGVATLNGGANLNNKKISGLAIGTELTDAANVGQLQAATNGVTNTAPVVYTKVDGTQVYKVGNAFFDNAAGTGTAVANADIITSIRSADGSTNRTTKLRNVAAGSIATNSTEAINGSQLNNIAQGNRTLLGGAAAVDVNGVVTSTNIGGTGASTIDGAISAANTQANKELTFTGNVLSDTGTNGSQQKLGSTLNISGGAATTATSSNANIKTVITDGKVDIQIVDAPTFTGQVKANGFDANSQKIVNVANGVTTSGSKDAINGGQLNTTAGSIATNLGGSATYDATTGTVTAPTYTFANGTATPDTFNNVGDALGNLDTRTTTNTGNIATNTSNIAGLTNGTAGIVRQNASTGAITVGGTTAGTSVSFAGTAGNRVLSGVADGNVAAASTEAVNGGQLYSTNQNVTTAQNTANTANTTANTANTTANSALGKANLGIKVGNGTTNNQFALGDTINVKGDDNLTSATTADGVQVSLNKTLDLGATGSVTTGASKLSNTGITITKAATSPVGITDITLTNAGLNNGGNKIINVAAGTLSDTSTDAVNGSQLNATNTKVTTNTTNIATNTSNIAGLTNGTAGIVRQNASTGAITVGGTTAGTSVSFAGTAGNRVLSGVTDGIAPTDVANVSQLKTSSVVAGNNTTVSDVTTGSNTQYTVNAAKSTVSAATDSGLAVQTGTTVNDVTDYAVELDAASKASLGKADSAVQTITSGNDNLTASKTGNDVVIGFVDAPTFTGQVKAHGFDANSQKIVNVANGATTSGSKDAINGGQLNTTADSIATNLGGGATYDATTGTVTAPTYTFANGTATPDTFNNVGDALGNLDTRTITNTTNIAANAGNIIKSKTTVTSGKNVEVTANTNDDGSANYIIKTKDDLVLNSVQIGDSLLDTNGLTIIGGPSVTKIGLNAGNKKITGVLAGEDATDAVNKSQLDAITGNITAGGVQYDRNTDNTVNYDRVSFAGASTIIGKDKNNNNIVVGGGTTLTNIANGINAADAVNKGQLDNVTKVKIFDKNGDEITVNIADQIVNKNVNNEDLDSLFLTYNVRGQGVTDRLTIGETVQKMNTEGVKFSHTNGVASPVGDALTNDSSAGGDNSTAIGVNAIITRNGESSIALGHNTRVEGASSVAIGNGSQANGNQSIAIGTGNIVNGDNSGAFGDPNIIDGSSSYSVGNNNNIDSDDTFVLGNNVTQTVAGSVVLGSESGTTTKGGIIGYLANINDINDLILATRSNRGAVAVGNAEAGIYRQITGVAAGTADSDAVNVSQLKAVNAKIDNIGGSNTTLNDAAVQYDKKDGNIDKGSITLAGTSVSTGIGNNGNTVVTSGGTTVTNVANGVNVSDAVNKGQLDSLGGGVAGIIGGGAKYENGKLVAGSNGIGNTGEATIHDAIASINNGNAQANESIKANTDSIKTNANNIKANNDSIKANTDDIKANTNRLNSGLSFGADSGNDINKSVGDSTAVKFEGGNNITTTATGNGIKFDLNGNISVDSVTTGNTTINNKGVIIKDGPSMTVDGIYAGDKTITGVADGIEVKDAVNFGQLNALDKRLGNSINELGYKINEVEDDANAGISAAMAMSSLPQAYIPGKSMVGGGIATYNGQSAVAVGVSKVSDNGRWVIKANGTADTQGNAGGAIGAGFHF